MNLSGLGKVHRRSISTLESGCFLFVLVCLYRFAEKPEARATLWQYINICLILG